MNSENLKVVTHSDGMLETYKMRSVAVLQKDVNVEEATPILKEKFTTGITGPF